MTYKREIEKKFVILNTSLQYAWYRLKTAFPEGEVVSGVSTDTFWSHPTVDFVRLRANTSELTIKITDKGSIVDRVEENVVVADLDAAYRLATALFGDPTCQIIKHYHVMNVGGEQPFTISLYTVEELSEVFLEVEGDSHYIVNEISELMHDFFDMYQEMRSLYQIVMDTTEAA